VALMEEMLPIRVSFETSFDSKQPKLEPKLVSALSETKRLFQLFRFYNETESFDVSIEPKQTGDQPKQFDREHILLFFTENVAFFSRIFSVFLFFSVFSVCFETVCFGCFASIPKQRVLIETIQTEDPPKQFKREYIWKFFQKFRVVSVCFGLLRNRYVCFGCFYIGSKHRNKCETDLVSVCFGSNRKLFLFVSRTPYSRCKVKGSEPYAWRGSSPPFLYV
jgi:hypothetical protein